MATTLSAGIALNLAVQFANPIDIGSGQYNTNFGPSFVLTDGTGAGQAKSIFTDTRTLTASATENLDLAGSLVDVFGNTITFTKIKALIIAASAGNTNDVIVGNATTNGFVTWCGGATHTVTVKPGGFFALCTPDSNAYAVTAGTGDLLKILNSAGGTSVEYTVALVGTT